MRYILLSKEGCSFAPHVLYRIGGSAHPTRDDFVRARDLGKPLVPARYRREWGESLSTYDDPGDAAERAAIVRHQRGEYLARLVIPDDSGIEGVRTIRDRHHFGGYLTGDRDMPVIMLPATRVRMDKGAIR